VVALQDEEPQMNAEDADEQVRVIEHQPSIQLQGVHPRILRSSAAQPREVHPGPAHPLAGRAVDSDLGFR